MTISQLLKKIVPFAKPYRRLIFYTLLLTVVGSFAAQINAFILRYTVDRINDLMVAKEPLSKGMYMVRNFVSISQGIFLNLLSIVS